MTGDVQPSSRVLVRYHFHCSECGAHADTQSVVAADQPARPRLPDGWRVNKNGETICSGHGRAIAPVIPFASLARAA